jgi:hypothetical protein
MMKKLLLTLALCLAVVSPSFATTYYVSTTGNDGNNGSSGSPWRNPQKCTETPVAAGDTCTVADGTYTDSDNNGIVVYAHTVAGTAGNPITIKATNRGGALITVPGNEATNPNAGFYISANYFIIDGFNISGGTATTRANHGIEISGATGTIVRNNTIHDIARTVCSNNGSGNTGIFFGLSTAVNTTIDSNLFYSIGRLRNGESGCSTTLFQNDHGLYIDVANGITVTHNIFYDTNRGYVIQFSGGTVTNATVENNTFADGSPSGGSPTNTNTAQIMLAGTITTATFKNNISYLAQAAMFQTFGLTCTNITLDYNLSDSADADMFKDATPKPSCATDGGHNIKNQSPGFVNAGSRNYNLAAGSAAIDAGVNVSIAYNGTAPDIGAFETFTG